MPSELETAANPANLKRVVIEPVTRVEGHGKVTLLLDEDNRVHQARFHIVEFRGFEKFVQGRPYTEVPVLVQRLCGICPVSHNLAASKAMDVIVGGRLLHRRTSSAASCIWARCCNPMPCIFFISHRPICSSVLTQMWESATLPALPLVSPMIARQGVALRKFGQEAIRVTSGKRVHGTGVIPGGMSRNLSRDDRDYSAERHRSGRSMELGRGETD